VPALPISDLDAHRLQSMRIDHMNEAFRALFVIGALAGALPTWVHATEGGGSVYPNGTENFLSGALPPPGLYGIVYGSHYRSTRVNGSEGQNLNVPGFNLTANVVAPRLVWVTGVKVLGGDLAVHAIVPLVDIKVTAGGVRQSKSGLGDVLTGLGLGFHHSKNFHSIAAVDIYLPTGRYDTTDIANLGRNQYAIEPVFSVTYLDPSGVNADIKSGFVFNGRNKKTDYRSGGEFHFDYALGWDLGNGWGLGVGGFYYHQVCDDRQFGQDVANSRAGAFAIATFAEVRQRPGLVFHREMARRGSSEESRAR